MSITITTVNFQATQAALRKELEKFRGKKHVTIGIHESAGQVEGGGMTMAKLGLINEVGASIDHPGGTDYGYATKKDAEEGKVRFLAPGKGYMQLGQTGPHKVDIPARPWLEPGVAGATPLIIETIANGIEDGLTPDQTLEAVGVVVAGEVRQYMTDLRNPPNAKSTIAKKKSDNPLIDKGHMRAAVTHNVSEDPVEEGL